MGRGCASLPSACAVLLVLVCPSTAAQQPVPGSLFEMPLPGGMRGALAALDDRTAPDRGQFLLEVIRRFHATPFGAGPDPRLVPLRSLLARLEASAADGARETLPLPLPPALWVETVFGGRATPDTLVGAILQSRAASLLYCGLLSLDGPTREWLATRRDVVSYLASGHSSTFLLAAPGLRVKDGRLQLPGGDPARAAWLTLAGVRNDDPAEFLRKVTDVHQGRLAYFLGAVSELTPEQVRFALNLDSRDANSRLAAMVALYNAFERVANGWDIDRLPFWRPALDPGLLLRELRVDDRGRPVVPGTTDLWSQVFSGENGARNHRDRDRDSANAATPVDFGWLCDRVFSGPPRSHVRPYNMVLFASRNLPRISMAPEAYVVEAVRAAGEYPALATSLERAGVADAGTFAAAARRAASVNAIGDRARAVRALVQFQGSVALVTRAAVRGGLPAQAVARLVYSLAMVPLSDAGAYDGRLVAWLATELLPATRSAAKGHDVDGETARLTGTLPGDAVEPQLLSILAGRSTADTPAVEWEGTRYRIDLAAAEATRLERVLGDAFPPVLSAARALVGLAESFEQRRTSASELAAAAGIVGELDAELRNHLQRDAAVQLHGVAEDLARAGRLSHAKEADGLAPQMRRLSDSLFAQGLIELVYAASFGQPGATPISVREAASRHDFGPGNAMRITAWQLPHTSAGTDRGWHVIGSLLGLDVKLAELSLLRVSSLPPARKPSLNSVDRQVFTETVSLVNGTVLADASRDAVLAALRRGRHRVASARTPEEVIALATEIGASAARRTLLEWSALHDSQRVTPSFSLSELLRLGMQAVPDAATLDGWGASGEPRVGCLCLRLGDRMTWDALAGRWNTGIFATAFPDLNLRLAELLDDLGMPSSLLGYVLAPATADFIDNVNSRDPDDGRGLVEFVQGLARERVEEYLALFTTDGPLLPAGDATDSMPRRGSPR